MSHNKRTHSLTIDITNLTEAQSIALKEMFLQMEMLGGQGGSRWVCFYADGDGDFKPKFEANGEKIKSTEFLTGEEMWKNGECRIDYDRIAWKLGKLDK